MNSDNKFIERLNKALKEEARGDTRELAKLVIEGEEEDYAAACEMAENVVNSRNKKDREWRSE